MRIVEGKDLYLLKLGFVETQKDFLNSPKPLFKYWESSMVSHSKSWYGAGQFICHMVG